MKFFLKKIKKQVALNMYLEAVPSDPSLKSNVNQNKSQRKRKNEKKNVRSRFVIFFFVTSNGQTIMVEKLNRAITNHFN